MLFSGRQKDETLPGNWRVYRCDFVQRPFNVHLLILNSRISKIEDQLCTSILKNLFMNIFLPFRKHYLVEGNSMTPLLNHGDIVYTKKMKRIRIGDVIIAHHPFRKKYIIKQVTGVRGTMLELRGLNPEESEDSRVFGNIPVKDSIGVVVSKKPKGYIVIHS